MEMEEKQIQVRFSTKLPAELHVPGTPFSLPAHLTRYGLSEVINALLGSEKPQPFDFLVEGELLRTSLEHFLLTRNLSAESIVNIEYLYAIAPPEIEKSWQHDDWVSAVVGSQQSCIITGSYDSYVRIWNPEGPAALLIKGHTDAVTSLAAVTCPASKANTWQLVSGSKDRTLRVWQIVTNKSKKEPDNLTRIQDTVQILRGHTSSVQCIAASPLNNMVCSGSWDCTLRLWKISGDSGIEEDMAHNKRRKLDLASDTIDVHEEIEISSLNVLQGHTQCVSEVVWNERDTVVSASWDHSVRTWNIETGVNTDSMVGLKALHCLSLGGENSCLIAAGGADPVLRIWDPRIPGTNKPILELSSHKAWITACKWHRTSKLHILSASHDGSVKLWDIRGKIPLQTIQAHQDKVLCADWWGSDSIVSGGADNRLQIFSKLQIH